MGATNDIKESNITLKLVGLACDNCKQKFTQWDMKAENYELWFDTSNEVELIEMTKTCIEFQYPFRKKGYLLSIWIRSLEHKDCPEIKDHE